MVNLLGFFDKYKNVNVSLKRFLTRIGTLVMILHDMADPLLELAKMFRYANYRKTCDSIFAMFALVWVVTRYIDHNNLVIQIFLLILQIFSPDVVFTPATFSTPLCTMQPATSSSSPPTTSSTSSWSPSRSSTSSGLISYSR